MQMTRTSVKWTAVTRVRSGQITQYQLVLDYVQQFHKMSQTFDQQFLSNPVNRKITDRQTDRQRWRHNLIGGGNNRISTAPYDRNIVANSSAGECCDWMDAGAVFDFDAAGTGNEVRQALQREVWRHNNRSVAAAAGPKLLVYDTVLDMSRQFQLSKSRTCFHATLFVRRRRCVLSI